MINSLSLLSLTTLLLLSFVMLMQSQVSSLVKLLIAQNLLLAALLLITALDQHSISLLFSCLLTVLLKVLLLPWLLWKLTTYLRKSGNMDPLINKPTLLLVGIGLTLLALMIGHQLRALLGPLATVTFSLSLANILMAILLIIFRRRTLSQLVGLLVLENSLFLLAFNLTQGLPWIIELGMSFDLMIGFMIFAVFLLRMRQAGALELQQLQALKESP